MNCANIWGPSDWKITLEGSRDQNLKLSAPPYKLGLKEHVFYSIQISVCLVFVSVNRLREHQMSHLHCSGKFESQVDFNFNRGTTLRKLVKSSRFQEKRANITLWTWWAKSSVIFMRPFNILGKSEFPLI